MKTSVASFLFALSLVVTACMSPAIGQNSQSGLEMIYAPVTKGETSVYYASYNTPVCGSSDLELTSKTNNGMSGYHGESKPFTVPAGQSGAITITCGTGTAARQQSVTVVGVDPAATEAVIISFAKFVMIVPKVQTNHAAADTSKNGYQKLTYVFAGGTQVTFQITSGGTDVTVLVPGDQKLSDALSTQYDTADSYTIWNILAVSDGVKELQQVYESNSGTELVPLAFIDNGFFGRPTQIDSIQA